MATNRWIWPADPRSPDYVPKETKAICAELNKLKKAVNDEGIRIEKEATAEVKEFRKELKKRTDRIDAVRAPLWEQVKPAPKVEPKKEVVMDTSISQRTRAERSKETR